MKYLSIPLLFLSSILFSQQKEIDSIKNVLPDQSTLDQVKSLNELSWYYKNFDLDSSILLAHSALEIGQSENSKNSIAQSLSSLANAYEAKGSLDTALTFHQQSFALREELNDTLGIASSLNNQGIVYDQLGKYELSLQSYFRSLRIYESKSNQPYDVAMVLGNIGIVYKKQKEYEKVLEYYQRALTIYDEVESEFGQTVTMGNIGGVLLLTGQYRETISYAEKALNGYKKAGYTRYIPYQLGNIAVAHDSLGQTQKARELYKEAEKLHAQHNNLFEQANTLIALGSNYRKTKEYQQAERSAERALSFARQIDATEFEVRALEELSKSLALQGRHSQAYSLLQNHNLLKDSLFELNKTKQIFELQTQYETEKKEQQIELQEAQISEQEVEIERNRILQYGSIVGFILLIVIAFLWISRIKKKQQLALKEAEVLVKEAEINATISSQEKERARYARDLHDGFGQMISILNMNIKSLEDGAKPNERQKVFESSEKVIEEMYAELKNICFDLMPQTLVKHGLESALQEFSGRINQAGKVHVELNTFGIDERLSELQEISLYRISQEWINNILKYSDAEKITLQITKDTEEITLLIEDDGMGFDQNLLSSGKGNGWRNLNTRANLVRGELELETTVGIKGNTLIVNAPTQRKTSDDLQKNTVETV